MDKRPVALSRIAKALLQVVFWVVRRPMIIEEMFLFLNEGTVIQGLYRFRQTTWAWFHFVL